MKKISQVNFWWAKNLSGSTEKLNDKFTVRFGETFVDFLGNTTVFLITLTYIHTVLPCFEILVISGIWSKLAKVKGKHEFQL